MFGVGGPGCVIADAAGSFTGPADEDSPGMRDEKGTAALPTSKEDESDEAATGEVSPTRVHIRPAGPVKEPAASAITHPGPPTPNMLFAMPTTPWIGPPLVLLVMEPPAPAMMSPGHPKPLSDMEAPPLAVLQPAGSPTLRLTPPRELSKPRRLPPLPLAAEGKN